MNEKGRDLRDIRIWWRDQKNSSRYHNELDVTELNTNNNSIALFFNQYWFVIWRIEREQAGTKEKSTKNHSLIISFFSLFIYCQLRPIKSKQVYIRLYHYLIVLFLAYSWHIHSWFHSFSMNHHYLSNHRMYNLLLLCTLFVLAFSNEERISFLPSPLDTRSILEISLKCMPDGIWNETNAGEIATNPCDPGYKGFIQRKCSLEGIWMNVDYTSCKIIQCPRTKLLVHIEKSYHDKAEREVFSIAINKNGQQQEVFSIHPSPADSFQTKTYFFCMIPSVNYSIQADTLYRFLCSVITLVGNLIQKWQSVINIKFSFKIGLIEKRQTPSWIVWILQPKLSL